MRAGYYVEGRYYADRFHQAVARATYCAEQWARPVNVTRIEPNGDRVVVLTCVRRPTGRGVAA